MINPFVFDGVRSKNFRLKKALGTSMGIAGK